MQCKYDTMDAKPDASLEANNAAAAAASAAAGVTEREEREKDAADVTLSAAAEADTDDTAGEERRGLRLSQEYIDFVMSWKPEVHEDPDELYARMMSNPAFTRDEVERTTKLQRELVEQSMECAASVESFHAWVCAEFKEKGYVEVDEDYIARGVELRKALEEDELYAVAFGPMDDVVAEGDEDDDDDFALAAGPTMDGVLSED